MKSRDQTSVLLSVLCIKLKLVDQLYNYIFPEIAEPAPIVNEAYAKRLEGSAIYLALKLSGGSRKTVDHAGGYGRKKRQAITFEEEAIMQQIFPGL